MNYHVKKSIYKPMALSKKRSGNYELIRTSKSEYYLFGECGRLRTIEMFFSNYKKCMTIFLTLFAVCIVVTTSFTNYLLGSMQLDILKSILHSIVYSIFILIFSKHIISQVVLMSSKYREKSDIKKKEKRLNFSPLAPTSYARQFDKPNAVLVRRDSDCYDLHYLTSTSSVRYYGENSIIRSNNISFAITAMVMFVASIIEAILVYTSNTVALYNILLTVFLMLTTLSLTVLYMFLFHKSIVRYS